MDSFKDFTSGFFLYIVSTVVAFVLGGLALSMLWGWFIVPTFDLPALDLVPAMGVSLVVRYLTVPFKVDEDEESIFEDFHERMIKSTFYNFIAFIIIVLLGWITQLFM